MKYAILQLMFRDENPKSIFEAGCANGGLLKDVSDHCGGLIVGGLDRCGSDLNQSKELFPEYSDNFTVHNILEIPWPVPDKSYDIVFTCGTLMYFTNPIPVIKEMLRIAKNKIILAEFHDDRLSEQGISKGEDHHGVRIIRNYKKIFEKLNLPITIEKTDLHKHIIKCQI